MAKNFAVVTSSSDGNNEEEIVLEVPSLWLHSNSTKWLVAIGKKYK